VEVQNRGKPIAHIVPIRDSAESDLDAFWANWDRLANAIGESWPEGVSAEKAIAEDRRDL
jgi:antitoxin (DNA-binding transcriptional repressor) of toxin-antitoxin stability system